MADFLSGEVPFMRALEILDVSAEELERLLDEGALKGFRHGGDVVFRREDLAAFITSGSQPVTPPPPAPQRLARDSKRDNIKKAAKGTPGPGSEMISLKKKAVEHGLVPEEEAPRPPRPIVPQVDAEAEILRAENESLRARLTAAEEVLNDLQRRCESATQFQSQNQVLVEEVQRLQVLHAELEAKVATYEELDEGGAEGPRWGAPDPEQQVISLKRQTAEMRGELAAMKRRLDDKDKDYDKLRMERDELSSKLKASATPGVDIARIKELEAEIVVLKQERDTLAVEAQIAHELKGEIERASELEEKLQTQREVIEAAQKGLAELETERDGLAEKVHSLEQEINSIETAGEKAAELSVRAQELEAELTEVKLKAAQMEARTGSLREERDKLLTDIEKRGEELAEFRVKADRAQAGEEAIEKLKAELEEAKSKASTAESEVTSVKVQLQLKDQLLEQLKTEEKTQSEMAQENALMRERLAEAETRAKQHEARLTAMRAERDTLSTELANRDGAMTELRTQAERANTLADTNRSLKSDLSTTRDKLVEAESALAAAKAERDKLAADLKESASKDEELRQTLRSQQRDLSAIRKRAEAGPEDAESERLRAELEALRSTISQQMSELGEMRAQGEQAATRRRSALEVVARRKLPSMRKQAQPGGAAKPAKLGRFEIGDEIRRSRAGIFYKASVQPSGKEAEVLVLPVDLTRDRYFLDRFWREMRVVVEIEEEGLLGVLDVGEAGGVHYVAYENVEGETLETILRKEEQLPTEKAVSIATAVLQALEVAAEHKLVHGDIKPENVIVQGDGTVKLTGLGLSRGTDEDASSLSERGRVVHFGAPEQVLGEDRDTKSDVWAVGALLFRAVSGKPPMEAGSLAEIRGLVQAGELPRAKDLLDIPDDLRDWLERMLAEKADERFASAADALKALKKVKL